MSPAARAEALLDEIGELYAIVLRVSRRIADDEAMTATQRLALIEVAAAGPLRLRNLASRMDTTPATASRAVDGLEALGLVRRAADPLDGRAIRIEATAKGRRWADRRRALLLEVLETVAPAVAPARLTNEIARLNAALREATGHDEVARGALLAP
ncbi:MAG TPA: MarR family transcriptional regulator [Gaiellaceae bacterium]|nr:MarR family transcriptional regulator [Gaiellaceae bacterium]